MIWIDGVKFNKTASSRSRLLGDLLTGEDIWFASSRLLIQIGEVPLDDSGTVEDYLHELAHHLCLGGVFRRRKFSIASEIEGMGPATADGNELDSLATELEAAWWLDYPLDQKYLASRANLSLYSERQTNAMITKLRSSPHVQVNGYVLARQIVMAHKRLKRAEKKQ